MRFARRRAFTLIEMLVAMAVTLIMMGSVVTIFGLVGDSISGSRASMEMSERLRNARNRLQSDLVGVTATMLPPRRPESDEGYFEYIEGSLDDSSYMTATTATGLPGDTDDILMFTTRSRGEPFVGRISGTNVESLTAEVAWYAVADGPIINPAWADPVTGTTHPLQIPMPP